MGSGLGEVISGAADSGEKIAGGDISDNASAAASGGDGEAACNDREALEAENMRLRGQLACARLGIPGEIARDIISIAAGAWSGNGDGDFEDTVKEVYERISAAVVSRGNGSGGRGSGKITTGVKVEKGMGVSDGAFRRACGLKN